MVVLARRLFHLQLGADCWRKRRGQEREDSASELWMVRVPPGDKKGGRSFSTRKSAVLKGGGTDFMLPDGWPSNFLVSVQSIVCKFSLFFWHIKKICFVCYFLLLPHSVFHFCYSPFAFFMSYSLSIKGVNKSGCALGREGKGRCWKNGTLIEMDKVMSSKCNGIASFNPKDYLCTHFDSKCNFWW